MMNRTTSHTVTFLRPFILDGFEQLQAAGSYIVDSEEELLGTLLFPAWKRISTIIRLSRLGATEHVSIDSDQLREALLRDAAQQSVPPPNSSSLRARRDRAQAAVAKVALARKV